MKVLQVMASKAKPAMLQFMCGGTGQVDDEGRPLYVLKKADDTLRQDQLILRMLDVFVLIVASGSEDHMVDITHCCIWPLP